MLGGASAGVRVQPRTVIRHRPTTIRVSYWTDTCPRTCESTWPERDPGRESPSAGTLERPCLDPLPICAPAAHGAARSTRPAASTRRSSTTTCSLLGRWAGRRVRRPAAGSRSSTSACRPDRRAGPRDDHSVSPSRRGCQHPPEHRRGAVPGHDVYAYGLCALRPHHRSPAFSTASSRS